MRVRRWPVDQVYLHLAPVDFRKSIDGLCALVELELELSPFSPALFVFCNRNRDKIKLLYWERNGFVLWYKVIESREKFVWPRHFEEEVVTLTVEQLNWLLDGYDVFRQPHRLLQLAYAS